MRIRVLTVLALAITLPAAVAGCTKTPRDRLQGRWFGDAIANAPEDQVAKATGWVKGTAIEFSGGRVTVTIPAETPRRGTFRIMKVDGDRLTVAFLRPEGGLDEAALTLSPDNRSMRWDIGGGREVLLVKAVN